MFLSWVRWECAGQGHVSKSFKATDSLTQYTPKVPAPLPSQETNPRMFHGACLTIWMFVDIKEQGPKC